MQIHVDNIIIIGSSKLEIRVIISLIYPGCFL